MPAIRVTYYSDLLCVWAYIAQARIDQLIETFGDQIAIEARFCSVFPDAWGKIEANWGARGGFAGFNAHLAEVGAKFPHVALHERLWLDARPRTSASAHLFLKAVELIEGEGPAPYPERLATRAAWALRQAFFAEARDISDWAVQREVAESLGIGAGEIEATFHSAEAFARLAADYDAATKSGIEGSPTFVMNEGRQKLFGNVGYRLLEANVRELLSRGAADEASWC